MSVTIGTGTAVATAPIVVNTNPVVIQPQPVVEPAPTAAYPAVLDTPVGQTVCNYVSYCRSYHSAAFVVFALCLITVVVLVWIGRNGTISLFNAAVGVTIAVAVAIVLMFLYWYAFVKGVIPECASANFSASAAIAVTRRGKVTTTAGSGVAR